MDDSGRRNDEVTDEDLLATAAAGSPQARAALAEASQWIADDSRILGVGLGEDAEGEECIVVMATSPRVHVPDEVDGLAVRVDVAEPFRSE